MSTTTDRKEAADAKVEQREREAALTKEQKAATEANNEAAKLRIKAEEDRVAAEQARLGKLTPEQKKANESAQEADDAAAKAAEAERAARVTTPMTMGEARVQGYGMNEEMPAGHHKAQKFGNDPENPAPAPGLSPNPGVPVIRLSRKTPDHPGLVYTECHPDMEGDYLRAGWNRATDLPHIRELPGKEVRERE